MWSTGTSALAPVVSKSVQCQSSCQARMEACKGWFVTEASIPVLTAADEVVVHKQIALPVDRQNTSGLPSGF